MKIVVIGGGAAGFFGALAVAEANPAAQVTILEQSPNLLGKVKISGGGRCNVTHACFEPRELVKAYPRGGKELLGPFHRFMTGDTMGWFEDRGVKLKIEADGRVFPISDDSQTIIDCFLREAQKLRVQIQVKTKVLGLTPPVGEGESWQIRTKTKTWEADRVLLASGSNQASWAWLAALGHRLIGPVPSLFTFNLKDERIAPLPGLSVGEAEIQVQGVKSLRSEGPLLVTHWGLSGPAILKLSAWGARELNGQGYQFDLLVNWQAGKGADYWHDQWQQARQQYPKRLVQKDAPANIPQRLWKQLTERAGIGPETRWADLSRLQGQALSQELSEGRYQVEGKSTFKEEFVTCGGVDLKEVNFKTMQSRLFPGLFFAGEVLNIDAVTGGFNFQAAWTTSWIAGQSMGR
ncbi:MAG: NAD(P)/FAD-dependent oxidoreductase [Bacteroidota bacterium]